MFNQPSFSLGKETNKRKNQTPQQMNPVVRQPSLFQGSVNDQLSFNQNLSASYQSARGDYTCFGGKPKSDMNVYERQASSFGGHSYNLLSQNLSLAQL